MSALFSPDNLPTMEELYASGYADGIEDAAKLAEAFAATWAGKTDPVCESACSAGNEIAALLRRARAARSNAHD